MSYKILLTSSYSTSNGAGVAQTLVDFDTLAAAEVAVRQVEEAARNSKSVWGVETGALRLYEVPA